MKVVTTVLIAAYALLAFSARAQLSVTGSAEIKVTPDIVEINLGVDVRDKLLDAAQKAGAERLAKILKALKDAGVPDKDVQSDFMDIHPVYSTQSNADKTTVEYFDLHRCIKVVLREVKNFDTVINSVLAAGVTNIYNVEFKSSKLREHRDQARINAVRAAKEKAELMAKELGVKVGKVTSITEDRYNGAGYYSYYGYYHNQWRNGYSRAGQYQNSSQSAGTDSAAAGTLAPGEIGISASVAITFQIE